LVSLPWFVGGDTIFVCGSVNNNISLGSETVSALTFFCGIGYGFLRHICLLTSILTSGVL